MSAPRVYGGTNVRSGLLAWVIVSATVTPALAEDPSDDKVAAGRRFAEMVCGACHAVTPQGHDIPILSPPASNFTTLARRPDLTDRSLREFLNSNHRNIGRAEAMPNPRLADYQIEEVVAYIMSLKAGN